ncbi:FAD-dependent oxidoreductase [Lyngbya confervoides]|uniref:FAD-dependent oxidoreductase n=1 Tax=Lyngbya confervoides BDU141951 TaxID=1574623 RepID=A0ABD4T8Z5_9CYAN|nr:FAD-dependent oxidoreductase [Lyngbya confervoides]MCM1985081.1 FAD-dependent oxidoreductase [Lyngbya confervoides BDU141951]
MSARQVDVSPLDPNSSDRSDLVVNCDILVVGGGFAGVAAAYEALHQGRTVCLSEITDWMGGQVSSQGTSALDETVRQRTLGYFPRGYLEFRREVVRRTGRSRPGDCWVSEVCFSPQIGHQILFQMLQQAERRGRGRLHWFPRTVVKSLNVAPEGSATLITRALAIQHSAQPDAPPLNTYPLSQLLRDFYQVEDSVHLRKQRLQFLPPPGRPWIVIEATETGELLALADVPYELGIDPRSYQNPSSSSESAYPYCTQALTYTFAMAATEDPVPHSPPAFYDRYAPFYSFDQPRYANQPNLVFTYRRIFSAVAGTDFTSIRPDDISMQNWGGGNDYGPGNPQDNIILTRQQLLESGQLNPGQWQGGLRPESLQAAEELALGYFSWWVQGTTDAKIPEANKRPVKTLKLLQGPDSPMGTQHGLSKYPYIRESRRLVGRYDTTYPQGFKINEVDISRQNFRAPFYRNHLLDREYKALITTLAGLEGLKVITDEVSVDQVALRQRSRLFPDSVGIGHYPIDFHPCMLNSPPESPGNIERPGERQGAARTYPYQIPLRAMIPQTIDNLVVTGKSIATSHISAATYRVQSFEWSAGAAAGTTAAFVLDQQIYPYELVETMPRYNPKLQALQTQLHQNQNPTAFPAMSIFNQNWQDW